MAQKRDGRTQRYEEVIFRNYSHVWIVTSERKRLEKHPVTQKELALGLAWFGNLAASMHQVVCHRKVQKSRSPRSPGVTRVPWLDLQIQMPFSGTPIPEPLEPSHALAGVASATIRKLGCVLRMPLRRSSAMAMAAAP